MENEFKGLTAKEFLKSREPNTFMVPEEFLIDFARHHVMLALATANLESKLLIESNWGTYENKDVNSPATFNETKEVRKNNYGHGDCTYEIIRVSGTSIINAYPITNIK